MRYPANTIEEMQNFFSATAANDAAQEALRVQDDLALKLVNTRPTTVAGAAALLTYYADATTSGIWKFSPMSM